jgi:hypothetical protein
MENKEEFNLSEKCDKFYDSNDNCKGLYWEKDVKEFIKRLKENINEFWTNGKGQCICPECWEHRDGTKETYLRTKDCMFLKMFEEINKLAGDKLNGSN